MKLFKKKPQLEKNWSPDQKILPSVEFRGAKEPLDSVKFTLRNIRRCHYRSVKDYDVHHYDKDYSMSDLTNAWLAISPFARFGAAHAFMSFGFADDTYLNVSIEVRRTVGSRYDPFKGMLRYFELMYVIADECDVTWLRTNCAKNTVRLYPIRSDIGKIRAVFMDVLSRVEQLNQKPEFYNTLLNNCTTNMIKHTRKFSAVHIPFWNFRYLFPETVDQIAYKRGIIDTYLSYEKAREHFDITQLAQEFDGEDRSEFSHAIRARFTDH